MVFTVSAANFKKILLAVPVAAAMVSIMGLLELLDGGARITSTFGHPEFFCFRIGNDASDFALLFFS